MEKHTAKETAEKLGISYCYLMRLAREGKIQHHRLTPRKIFFTDEDIETILNNAIVKA